MKTYQRISLRRLEAALRRRAPANAAKPADLVPVEAPDYPASPTEVIDLATGPFRARFPELVDE